LSAIDEEDRCGEDKVSKLVFFSGRSQFLPARKKNLNSRKLPGHDYVAQSLDEGELHGATLEYAIVCRTLPEKKNPWNMSRFQGVFR
jgi:hypothetical protein